MVTDDRFRTSLQGVFAAGDVRSGSTKQVGTAAGEGIAALFAIRSALEAAIWPDAPATTKPTPPRHHGDGRGPPSGPVIGPSRCIEETCTMTRTRIMLPLLARALRRLQHGFHRHARARTRDPAPVPAPAVPATAGRPPSRRPPRPTRRPQPPSILAHRTAHGRAHGRDVHIADLAGKLVVIEPMAIWCSNCASQQKEASKALAAIDERGRRVHQPGHRPE